MFKEKLLQYLIHTDPELCAEVFCKDFIGIVPTRMVDSRALEFLRKNSVQLEPWILSMNHSLQREQTLYGKKLRNPGFYEGAMFILRLFYTKVNRYVPQKITPTGETNKPSIDPLAEVEAFEKGFKEKDNGQKDSVPQSQGSEVQNV